MNSSWDTLERSRQARLERAAPWARGHQVAADDVHELLRQYAEGKLNDEPAERERVLDLHSAYYAELLDRKKIEIDRGYHRAMLPELDNIRAAWQHAAD